MQIVDTELLDVKLLIPKVFGDDRGFFLESWNSDVFATLGLPTDFVQDNHSRSSRGVLRGLHYQLSQPQGKLVRVTQGKVFDVAVDLRKSSVQFGLWTGVVLSEQNMHMLWVPPGYAHGFYVMSESADFLYKCTNSYQPKDERALRWNDSDIGIVWPLLDYEEPSLAERDRTASLLKDCDTYD